MTSSFDLTSSPWIPCERSDGSLVELSTREVFARAHELRGIADDPLVAAALHRHLLAVVHRAYDGPRSRRDWAGILAEKGFDAAKVDAYLNRVRDRMDLFHPTHPFAQTRGLVQQFSVDPIDQLGVERSKWGGARALFQHRGPDYRASMSPAQAARALLAHHAFATGGLVKKPGEPTSATAAPLVRAAVVILRGSNLFETLATNLLVYAPSEGQPIPVVGEDKPSWEQEAPPRQLHQAKEPKHMPAGWLDMLTWLSRRIELVCEGDEVTGYVRAVGQGMAEEAPRDPMVVYSIDKKRGIRSIGINPHRAFWRDANALFEVARGDDRHFERPKAIDLVASPEAQAVLGDQAMFTLDVLGLSAEKSRVDVVRAEHVRGTARLFADADAGNEVEHALDFADKSVRALRSALWLYAMRALSPGDGSLYERRSSPRRLPRGRAGRRETPSECTSRPSSRALDDLLAEEEDFDAARVEFERCCRRKSREPFRGLTSTGEGSARRLKARALAERVLWRELPALSSVPRPRHPCHSRPHLRRPSNDGREHDLPKNLQERLVRRSASSPSQKKPRPGRPCDVAQLAATGPKPRGTPASCCPT